MKRIDIGNELHNMNNYMTVIIGNIDILLNNSDKLPKDVLKRIKDIDIASTKMTDSLRKLSFANQKLD